MAASPRRKRTPPVTPDLEGFGKALAQIGVSIWHDVREEKFFYTIPGQSDPEPVNDLAMAWVRLTIGERVFVKGKEGPVPWKMGKDAFYEYRNAHGFRNSQDGFRVYLDSLKPPKLSKGDVADYDTPIDHMLADSLGALSDNYHRHISRMILLSAVWRTYEPGYKVDEVAVIKGKQGVGKDSLLSSLVPHGRFHTDSFSFGIGHKSKIEVTRGKVLVVASEMGGVTTTKDLEHLKQYVTAQHDDIRLAYRRDADYMPRRFCFVCTTNLDKPLPDDATGNRRWCVAQVMESQVGAVEPWVEARRDQFWGIAVAMYRMGIKPNLPREMKEIQSLQNEDYRRADEGMQDAYITAVTSGILQVRPQTLTKIAQKLGLLEGELDAKRLPRELQHRLRNELELQGWVAKTGRLKRSGPKQRLWFPDNVDPELKGKGQ